MSDAYMSSFLEKIIAYTDQKKNIYIYGVGKYGRAIYELLKENRVQISGFLVSEKDGVYKDKPIYAMRDILHKLRSEDGIVLAMKVEYQHEVLMNFPQLQQWDVFCPSAKDWLLFTHRYFFENIARLTNKYPPCKSLVKEEWKNILIVRLDLIGDFVVTTPFIRELRRNFPKANITLVVRKEIKCMLSNCPYIDDVIGVEYSVTDFYSRDYVYLEKTTKEITNKYLNNKVYDVVFLPRFIGIDDLFMNVLLAVYSGAAIRIARQDTMTSASTACADLLAPLFTVLVRHVKPQHEVKQILELLTAIDLSYVNDRNELWLSLDDDEIAEKLLNKLPELRIAIGLVSRDENRTWGKEKYYLLIKKLQRIYGKNISIILMGGIDAVYAAKYIIDRTKGVVDLTQKTSISVASAVLSKCNMYVGANTGLLHIASAFGKKIVEISAHLQNGNPNGGIAPQRFGAWRVPCITLQPKHGLDQECERAGYCKKKYSHCINQISVEEVFDAVKQMLDKEIQKE